MKFLRPPFKIKTFGNSMMPLLRSEDVVYIKKINFSAIKVNDIICIGSKKGYLTHRVIYRTKSYLITKGDNTLFIDGKIYPKRVVGIAYKVKRGNDIFGIQDLYLLQSTLYLEEIAKVTRVLNEKKIDHAILKGLPLHLYFEKTHPKRIYADCDILINKKSFGKIKKIFAKTGFNRIDTSLSTVQERLKDKESEISFCKMVKGFLVVFDIHLEVVFMMTQLGKLDPIYPQKFIDKLSQQFLDNMRHVKVYGSSFPILSNSHLLIYLCLHLFHHNFKGAYRYEFINNLIKSERLNYDEIKKQVKEYKLESFVYPVILFLKRYYDTAFPKYFEQEIMPKKKTLKYIKKNILKENIFDEGGRMAEGQKRFRFLFNLSPNPLYKKVQVFWDAQVIYAVAWALYKRFKLLSFSFLTRP